MKKTRNKSTTRLCKKCDQIKDLSEFYIHPRGPHWVICECKDCKKTYSRKQNWKNRDGLDVEAAEVLRNSTKICELCNEEKFLHVDHNHTTGKLRGMLCFTCNAALGQLKDDKDLCLKAARYLEKYAEE